MIKINMLNQNRLTEYPTRVKTDYSEEIQFFKDCALYLIAATMGCVDAYFIMKGVYK